MTEELVVETPGQRRWLFVWIGLVMTGASLWVVLQTRAGWIRFLVVPGTLFFGLGTGYALYRAVRPTAAVVLTRDGFTDHASALAFGFVAWNEVARIRAVTFMGQPMVCVTLRNPEVALQRLRTWKRPLVRFNQRFVHGDVCIPANVLPTGASDFAKTMDRWRRKG